MSFINIGFGNVVNSTKISAIVSPDSAPIKRLIQKAKEEETILDATQGRRTKGVILLENQQIVLSALTPETLSQRATISDERE